MSANVDPPSRAELASFFSELHVWVPFMQVSTCLFMNELLDLIYIYLRAPASITLKLFSGEG
jgi:hypothetical protein